MNTYWDFHRYDFIQSSQISLKCRYYSPHFIDEEIKTPPRIGPESHTISITPCWDSQVALMVKNPPANAGEIRDMGLIPELERSPGGEHDNPL